jgi:hypothetical protein
MRLLIISALIAATCGTAVSGANNEPGGKVKQPTQVISFDQHDGQDRKRCEDTVKNLLSQKYIRDHYTVECNRYADETETTIPNKQRTSAEARTESESHIHWTLLFYRKAGAK